MQIKSRGLLRTCIFFFNWSAGRNLAAVMSGFFFFLISYKWSHFTAAVLQNRLWKCGWSCQTHQHLLDQRISVYLLLHSVPASILGRGPVSHLTLWLRVQDFWSQIFNPRSNFSNCAITYCKERERAATWSLPQQTGESVSRLWWPGQLLRSFSLAVEN